MAFSSASRYGLAALMVASALVITALIFPAGQRGSLLLVMAAVVLAALYGGLGPGLLASGLGVLGGAYLLMEPQFSLNVRGQGDLLRLVLFAFASALIGYLVAARRGVEQRLREGERRLSAVLEQMPAGLLVADAAGRLVMTNPRVKDLLGFGLEPGGELSGYPARGFRDGVEIRAGDWPLERALRGEAVRGEGLEVLHADGRRLTLRVSASPVRDEAGRVVGAIAVFDDLSDLRRAEQELHRLNLELRHRLDETNTLLDLLPTGVWVGNADVSEIRGNPAGYRMFGLPEGLNASLTSPQPELPQGIRLLVDGAEVQPEDAPMQRAARTGQPIEALEHTVVLPDGTARTVIANIAPLLDPEGRVRGVIGAYTDITERKRIEQALRESEGRYRELVEAQKRFVNDAAHELRAPLTAIQGNLELIHFYPQMPAEERLGAVSEAVQEARRLSRLVNDMLALARGDAGVGLQKIPLDLASVLQEACQGATRLANGQHLEITELKPCPVQGDPDRLKQLLLILFDNALKYTPAGGRVNARLRCEEGWAEVRVADTGVGIHPDDLPHVFERFYRADKARMRGEDPGGTGLGLSIAKQIVEAHGGEIRLESEPGRGTTAVVRLPANQ